MQTAVRYWLIQAPATLGVALLLHWGHRSGWIPGVWVAGLLLAWVTKDALMYGVTKDAYSAENARLGHPVGELGTVRQPLAPRGTVWLDGAIWKAELAGSFAAADRGARVRVMKVRGLLLVVEPVAENDDGIP